MIIIESQYDNLEEALSEVFSDTTKKGIRTRRLVMKGTVTICLSTEERWCRANASEVQKKLRQTLQGRKHAPRLKMRDHYLFINYDTANLAHLYCADCAAWMDFTREELPTTETFKEVSRPLDH